MSILFTPLERLIHILSNGVTNSIFVVDIRPISLEHVTYTFDLCRHSHPPCLKMAAAETNDPISHDLRHLEE